MRKRNKVSFKIVVDHIGYVLGRTLMYIGLVVVLDMLFLKCGITASKVVTSITAIATIAHGILKTLGISGISFVKWLLGTSISTVLSAFASGQTIAETKNNLSKSFAALRKRKTRRSSKTAIATVTAFGFVLIGAPVLAANHVVSTALVALHDIAEVGSEDVILHEDTGETLNKDEVSVPIVEDTMENDIKQDVVAPEVLQDRPLAYRLVIDPVLERTISTGAYQEVFFLSGEYTIADWDSEEVIIEQVRSRVGSLVAKQIDPNYDEVDTPQSVQNDIARASVLEQSMANSEDLQVVIGLRLDAYDAYPEYRLAKLLRENYALWGDAYHYQGFSKNSAVFYYVESIEWGYETISYQTSTKSLAQNLAIIAERYLKIAQASPRDSATYLYASKLGNAFLEISSAYRQVNF